MAVQSIIDQLEGAFNGPAWHGPTVMETLSSIKVDNANASHHGSHSILDLLGHMTIWKQFVIEMIRGNESFKVTEEINFPKQNDVKSAVDELISTHGKLIEALREFPEARLQEKVSGHKFTFEAIFYGIIHHDVYHQGQIAILNK